MRGEREAGVWHDRRLGRRTAVGEHVLTVEVGPTIMILIVTVTCLVEIEFTCSRLVLTMICGFLAENSSGFQGTPGPNSGKKCY